MINKSLNYDTELMIITMEECGELIEACSKAIRCENYKDKRLTEEVGDVLFLIDLIIERGLVTSEEISNRMEIKKEKLKKWSNLINE
tara:strand:- start:52 stop:312 length:261 start_codon:yes stop_codon:yes gene_type:complete